MSKPRLHAEPAYENTHLVARDLLERIDELLSDLPQPGGSVKINWAMVTAMADVNHRLASIVETLEGWRR